MCNQRWFLQVPALDPRHTNFLTDIRIPEYKPSPLDEIGFLSNSSDEDVEMASLSVAPHNLRPKVNPLSLLIVLLIYMHVLTLGYTCNGSNI